MNQVKRLQALK